MRVRYLLAVFCFITIACIPASAQVQGKKLSEKELKKLMQGSWFGAENDDAAVFYIGGDSITYIDDFAKFKYTLVKDTFDLKTTEMHYKELILRISPDSLILKEVPSGEINKYWRN
jgi:hypothetical protein